MSNIKDAANELLAAAIAGRIAGLAFVFIDHDGLVRTEAFEGDDPFTLLGALDVMKAQLCARVLDDDDDEPDSGPAETEAERTGEDP